MSGELPPANWYPDPSDPGRQRYWDGARWTSQTRDVNDTPPPPPQPSPQGPPPPGQTFAPPPPSGAPAPPPVYISGPLRLEADKEPLSTGFNFTWEILGGATAAAYDSFTVETESFGCGVVPDEFGDFDEVFVGGTLSGTVCIPIPAQDLDHPDTQIALHFAATDSRIVFGD